MANRILLAGLMLSGCYGGSRLELDSLAGRYHIPATYFYKWGKEVDIEVTSASAVATIRVVSTKEVSADTLAFIHSEDGDLIRLEGKTIVIKRALRTKIFVREPEHGLLREEALGKFRTVE